MYALRIVFSERPDLVLCNGPGTCVPVAYAAWLMKVLRVKPCSIVFTVRQCRPGLRLMTGCVVYTL